MPKLALPDAHPRGRIADAQLGLIKDTLREPHAVLHKVDDEGLAIEVAILVRVHLHLGMAIVILHEHTALGEASGDLVGCGVEREVGDNAAVFFDACGLVVAVDDAAADFLPRFFGGGWGSEEGAVLDV
jgi:hypothetical protein